MIYRTRKAATNQRHKYEKTVPVVSEWKRCELGCHCIRVKPRLIGYSNILDS